MNIMTQKKKAAEPQPVAEMEPVELDPPAPEIVRWQELADVDVDICHDGDASRVLDIPRPAWSDPDEDTVSATGISMYVSAPACVAVRNEPALVADDGDTLQPTRVKVSALLGRMCGQDLRAVEVRIVRPVRNPKDTDKPWMHTRISMTIPEARQLVDVLQAVVELVGGE